jgi:hypothetical protein
MVKSNKREKVGWHDEKSEKRTKENGNFLAGIGSPIKKINYQHDKAACTTLGHHILFSAEQIDLSRC